jgi:hypothetical protein
MKVQPDGKLLIAFFEFGVNNGIAAQDIARFNTDGTADASFNTPRLASGTVASIALQSNGKILIRGNFAIEIRPTQTSHVSIRTARSIPPLTLLRRCCRMMVTGFSFSRTIVFLPEPFTNLTPTGFPIPHFNTSRILHQLQ